MFVDIMKFVCSCDELVHKMRFYSISGIDIK